MFSRIKHVFIIFDAFPHFFNISYGCWCFLSLFHPYFQNFCQDFFFTLRFSFNFKPSLADRRSFGTGKRAYLAFQYPMRTTSFFIRLKQRGHFQGQLSNLLISVRFSWVFARFDFPMDYLIQEDLIWIMNSYAWRWKKISYPETPKWLT